MQMHNDTKIIDDRQSFRKIYLSLLFERVVCERELETAQNGNILTPTLLAITMFLSRSPGLFNLGPGGPLCWVLTFSIAFVTNRSGL